MFSHDPQVISLPEGNTTVVTSPAFPLFYPANIDVQWQVLGPSESSIRLVFAIFSLATDVDFLYIGKSIDFTKDVTNVTGSVALGMEFISGRPELWLRFVAADVAVHLGMGFAIELSTEGECLISFVRQILQSQDVESIGSLFRQFG